MAITFNGSPEPTIGVEVELQILDPETKKLVSGGPKILEQYPNHPRVKPELIQSTIEINTEICKDVKQVRKDLKERLDDLNQVCEKLGYVMAISGTHPYSYWSEQKITKDERYYRLVDRCQWPARRLMIFGLHVHIGISSGEKAIAIFNSLTSFLPQLLALSASSPFWEGEETGLASTRVKVFESLPTAGLPYRLLNWAEFQYFMNTLINANAIKSIREVWWDIRPHPGFGTVELRICDGLPTLTEIVSMTALVQALVVWLSDQYDEGMYLPIYRHWVVRENKWRAARYATDARIIVQDDGGQQPMSDSIEELLELLSPVAKRLGSYQELMQIKEILQHGPSYRRQLAIYKETGDFVEVVNALITELREDRYVTV